MTVSSSVNKVIGTGNGVTTVWPFSFKCFDATHLQVIYTSAAGVDTTLAASAYVVALTADQNNSPGGTVTYTPAIAAGTALTILRVVPYTQAADIENQGAFYPSVLERAYDLLAMQVQQVVEIVARCLKLSPSQSAIDDLEATNANRASTYLGFDANGELALYTGVGSGTAVSVAMAPVVSAASLAAARTAMAVVGLGANTFTGAQSLPGNAASALQAVPLQQIFGVVRYQTFTANGTYTPHANMVYCEIECVGGGGGGGGTATAAAATGAGGGGGGSGGYSRKLASRATIGASQAVTIGAAGAAGAAGNNNGGAGGDTSVGALCIGKGASGGFGNTGSAAVSGGAGGIAGTGDVAAVGGYGGTAVSMANVAGLSGAGAASALGGGARAMTTAVALAGEAAPGKGGGGSGGASFNAGGTAAGGAGGAGFVAIKEFCSA